MPDSPPPAALPAPRRRRRALLVAASLLLALVVLEVSARIALQVFAGDDDFRKYATLPQLRARFGEFSRFEVHRHLGFALSPGYRRGDNRHNAAGYRGDEIAATPADGVVRIICAGGSTTYGEGVPGDYRLAYPFLLEHLLRQHGDAVEVVNAGVPGWTTLETLINFETRVLDLRPDILVVYHGINDVLSRMVWPPAAFRGDHSGWLRRRDAIATASIWESSTLLRYLMVRSGSIPAHGSMLRIIGDEPESGRMLAFREQRLDGSYPAGAFREVPIERILQENSHRYTERNLRNTIAVANANDVQVVLTTFAFSKAWPQRPNIGHPAVQAALVAQNEMVRRVAAEMGAHLFDLARVLEDDPSLYTDGVHFSAEGNLRRATLLGARLLELGLLER